MKVIATATGFDGKSVRAAGDEFEMPEGARASWFVPAEDKKPGKSDEKKPGKPGGKSTDDLV